MIETVRARATKVREELRDLGLHPDVEAEGVKVVVKLDASDSHHLIDLLRSR